MTNDVQFLKDIDGSNFNDSYLSVFAKKEIRYWLGNGILFPKLFWLTVRKKCSSEREKLLKFEAEGGEFAKLLRSLEQFIWIVKFQTNFWNICSWRFLRSNILEQLQLEKNYWDSEICRKSQKYALCCFVQFLSKKANKRKLFICNVHFLQIESNLRIMYRVFSHKIILP